MKTSKILFRVNFNELEFTPLENGRNEYVVTLHDFGNLESVVSRRISGFELNKLIDLIQSNKYAINYLRFL